jgi:SAM-dependent methyltransferase
MKKAEHRETDWLHFIRGMELDSVSPFLANAPGQKLLEIGGGDGFLAQRLSEMSFQVTSIDIAPRTPLLYPVQAASGTDLDFPDATFDILFTSHVIAHIRDKKQALAEMKRVLKPGGIAIHIVPSTWWTIVTNSWHFGMLPLRVLKSVSSKIGKSRDRNRSNKPDSRIAPEEIQFQSRRVSHFRLLLLNPLGENPSFVHELLLFSQQSWTRFFETNGSEVLHVQKGPLLQSGYRVFPFRAQKSRKFLARFFPSSFAFFVRPRI